MSKTCECCKKSADKTVTVVVGTHDMQPMTAGVCENCSKHFPRPSKTDKPLAWWQR